MKHQKPFVFIITQYFEPNVDSVTAQLDKKEIPWFRLNTETIPLITNVRLFAGNEELYAVFKFNGTEIDTRNITALWRRRIGEFVFPNVKTEQERGFIRHECASMLHGAFESMHCFWVNHFISDYRANVKPYQFEVARRVGLKVPKTIITNDPAAVNEFVESISGTVLFKPVIGLTTGGPPDFSLEIQTAYKNHFNIPPAPPINREPEVKALLSQLLTIDKIPYLKLVAGCPAIFQEYINKRIEIRITIIGNNIFAAEIHSQEREDTKVDFRAQALAESSGLLHHEPHNLPDEISNKLLILMRELNLVFGCVDMILTPEGEYVFLEVNTAGQWQWIENLTGMPITNTLTNLLISGGIQ